MFTVRLKTSLPATLLAAALCAGVPASADAKTPSGNYGGATSQGEVATATVGKTAAGAPRIKRFAIHWVASNCTVGGNRAPESTTFISGPAAADGSFGPLQGTYIATGSVQGTTQSFDWNLRGKISTKKVSATFHLVVTEKDAAGNVTFRCDTGQIAVSLPHHGVYIGETSNREFGLVVLRSSKPTEVRDFRINWQAPCNPQPGLTHITSIAKLAVSKRTHRFSTTVPVTWDLRNGNHVAGAATLKGKRSDSSVSGTFTFSGSVTTPSGQKVTDCSTAAVTFKARPG